MSAIALFGALGEIGKHGLSAAKYKSTLLTECGVSSLDRCVKSGTVWKCSGGVMNSGIKRIWKVRTKRVFQITHKYKLNRIRALKIDVQHALNQ